MAPKGRIEVNEVICKGCSLCVENCPQKVLALAPVRINQKGYHPAELIEDGCTGCAICAMMCPEAAITVFREVKKAKASA
ncbi:MAG: ferredoxin family protein [Anaerolineaceae bacterium]|nr:ferredoxin family protein [Anaerolineaceae bacterium]